MRCIKPCPYCGGTGELLQPYSASAYVQCSKCKTGLSTEHGEKAKERAISIWNTWSDSFSLEKLRFFKKHVENQIKYGMDNPKHLKLIELAIRRYKQ